MYNNTIPPPLVAVFIKYLNTILKNEVSVKRQPNVYHLRDKVK